MFETVQLWTRDRRLVEEVVIPHFVPPAEILQWGGRFFVRGPDGAYVEGMLWPVMPAMQASDEGVSDVP